MAVRTSESEESPGAIRPRYPEGCWDNAAEHLQLCRTLHHNGDYLEFLVTRVWRLDRACRPAEFGCDCRAMGLRLVPLLAQGSTVTGTDQSSSLVSKGRQKGKCLMAVGLTHSWQHAGEMEVIASLLGVEFGVSRKRSGPIETVGHGPWSRLSTWGGIHGRHLRIPDEEGF